MLRLTMAKRRWCLRKANAKGAIQQGGELKAQAAIEPNKKLKETGDRIDDNRLIVYGSLKRCTGSSRHLGTGMIASRAKFRKVDAP